MENTTIKRKVGRPRKYPIIEEGDELLLETLDKILPFYELPANLMAIDETSSLEEIELKLLIFRLKRFIQQTGRDKEELNKKKRKEKKQRDKKLNRLLFIKGYMKTKLDIAERETKRLKRLFPDQEGTTSSLPTFKIENDVPYNPSLPTLFPSSLSLPPSPPPSQQQQLSTFINDNDITFSSSPPLPSATTSTIINTPITPIKINPLKFTFSPLRYGLSKRDQPSSSSSSS